jgi:alpha-L-fucosidase
VAEFAQACRERGLGLFLYYSYGVDWRHPYSMPRELYECARPGYTDMSHYRYRQPGDFKHFVDDMHAQLRELLTGYGPVAGVWFDLISACYFCPEFFPVAETYALIRSLQPHALISFKQGFTGDEDFLAQEVHFVPISERLKGAGASPEAVARSEWAWQTLLAKRRRHEVCLALQSRRWAWIEGVSHRSKSEVAVALTEAEKNRCNLLLNVGPRPDGSLEPVDEDMLVCLADNDFATEAEARSHADTQAAQHPDIPA